MQLAVNNQTVDYSTRGRVWAQRPVWPTVVPDRGKHGSLSGVVGRVRCSTTPLAWCRAYWDRSEEWAGEGGRARFPVHEGAGVGSGDVLLPFSHTRTSGVSGAAVPPLSHPWCAWSRTAGVRTARRTSGVRRWLPLPPLSHWTMAVVCLALPPLPAPRLSSSVAGGAAPCRAAGAPQPLDPQGLRAPPGGWHRVCLRLKERPSGGLSTTRVPGVRPRRTRRARPP